MALQQQFNCQRLQVAASQLPEDTIFRDTCSEQSACIGHSDGDRCRTVASSGTSSSRPSCSSYQSEPPKTTAPAADARTCRSRTQSARTAVRQNAVEFDESEYFIVHSNAVETTEMTPFYPQPKGGGRKCGQVHEEDAAECDKCSLISDRSRKSRKSSNSSASRLRRELRKSAAVLEAGGCADGVANGGGGGGGGGGGVPSANIFTNIKGLFTKWLHESKVNGSGGEKSLAGGGKQMDTVSYLNIACPQFPQECSHSDLRHAHNVMSMNTSFDSDYLLHCYTNVSSSVCSTSAASTNGDFFVSGSSGGHSSRQEDCELEPLRQPTLSWDLQVDYDILQRRNPRQVNNRLRAALDNQATITQPTKAKSLQSQTARNQKDLLCSTWPPSGRRLFAADDECIMNDPNYFHVMDSVLRNSRGSFEIKEFEFNIPYDGIQFQECLLKGKRKRVHRGQWHGDVTIHTYESLDCQERSKFWEEVAKLSLIRHENIFLFMGASMDPPTSRFAVVTSVRKGASLYDKVHVLREKLNASYKLSIIRDLAQAAGYLHAKGILIKRFNSRNVFLEPRAKLSLQDYSVITEDEEDRPGYLVIPASLIWYTPPEILTLLTGKTSIIPDSAFTPSSDVFAFSVIMYEVCSGRYPFAKRDSLQYMDCVCQGKRDSVQELRVSEMIKCLITDCWNHDPLYRPEFTDINYALNNRETSHLRHSSSEPEHLHRLQLVPLGCL